MKPRLQAEPALVGRERQIEQLLQHLDFASNARGTTVLIGGEAGVGKTRLVEEFLSLAKQRGARVLSGWCLSEATVPYFPFTEAFNAYLSTISDANTKTALTQRLGITGWLRGPDIGPKPQVPQLGITGWLRGPTTGRESQARQLLSTPEIERDRTFEATAAALLQLSTQKPVILFLDDLHWADHLSLALLHYVARRCRNSRLLIIGTYRSEELVRTKEEKLHPLEEAMFSMNREDLLTKMELSRLKREDLPELLTSLFHSQFDEGFAAKLFAETEGNPLFVLETLSLLVEEGILAEDEERWMLTAPAEQIGVPSKVHEVIIRRVSRLGREERRLLDLAAVCGHSFKPDTLRRILAVDLVEILEKLVAIEESHRLIRSTDSIFEFTHQKIREVIHENLQGELRKAYHLKTASCLEQVLAEGTSDGNLADIAFHYVEGGASEKAFGYLIRLAENAVEISANEQAIDYLNKALEASRETASLASNENLVRIYRTRGRAWTGRGEIFKAIDDFNLFLQSARSLDDESVVAEAHYWLGDALKNRYGWTDAKKNLSKAIDIARKIGDKLIESRSLASLGAALLWYIDTLEESPTHLEEAIRISLEIGDKAAYASSRSYLGFFYNWRGEFDVAVENLSEALKLFEELGDRFHVLEKLMMLGWAYCGKGEYNDAISVLLRCLRLARQWNVVYFDRATLLLTLLGWIHRDLSHIELALRYDTEALEVGKLRAETGVAQAGVPVPALVDLGMDYLKKSDYANAEKHFKEATPLLERHRFGGWRLESRILLGFAETALHKGDFQNALKYVEDSLAISEQTVARKYIAKGLKLKAEVLAEMDKSEEAIELMGRALKLAKEVGNPPLLWQTHYSMGLLLEKHGNLQEASHHFAEAVAINEETVSKLKDASLRATLLAAPQTKAIHDAYARTNPTS